MNLLATIAAAARRWQEPLFWLPAALLLLVCAYYVLPQIDPRAGIDGFGGLFAALLTAFNALLAGFLAWLLRSLYFLELPDAAERELLDHAAGIDRGSDNRRVGSGPQSWPALVFLIGDRTAWLALFAILFTALQG